LKCYRAVAAGTQRYCIFADRIDTFWWTPAFRRGERTAEDGLDLARVCPGRADGSTTKQIAHALTETIRSADYYIDLHTGGRAFCVLPLTGYSLHADASVLDCQRRMAHAFNLGVVWGTKPLPGRSLSVAADAGIPAIYAEYFGAAICAAAGVEAYVAGCLNVMGELGMVDRTATESCVSVVVEDDGPDSGHMQMQNQAPMAGLFEPAVSLGDSVRVGDLLGTLTDTMGDRVEPMRSQQNGIVLVLRTFPMVDVGDSIGVVLPAPRDEKSKS